MTARSRAVPLALSLCLFGSLASCLPPHPHFNWRISLVLLIEGLLLGFVSVWAYKRRYRRNMLATHKGIGICDMRQVRVGQKDFVEWTRQAIDLVEKHDLRRFRRIQRHCRYIANRELVSAGAYSAWAKACLVDFSGADFEHHPEWYLIFYAGLLVHEATHGVMDAKKIPYDKAMRLRIEYLCRKEERRFLNRICPAALSLIAAEPDEEWLRRYWNRKEYAKMWKERMKDVRQSASSNADHVWERLREKARRIRAGLLSRE